MKLALTLLIAISFLGVAVFGFSAMGHRGVLGGCLAETVNGKVCPSNNALAAVSFFSGAFQKFSQAIFTDNASVLPALYLILFAFAGAALAVNALGTSKLSIATTHALTEGRKLIPSRSAFIRWFALHENSPNF